MRPTLFEKIALGLSGLTALAIGAFILFAPHALPMPMCSSWCGWPMITARGSLAPKLWPRSTT